MCIKRSFTPYQCRIQDCLQVESEIYQNNHILLLNFQIRWQRVTTNIYEVWTYVNVTPHYHCKQLIVAVRHRYEIDKLSSGMQCFFQNDLSAESFDCNENILSWNEFRTIRNDNKLTFYITQIDKSDTCHSKQ